MPASRGRSSRRSRAASAKHSSTTSRAIAAASIENSRFTWRADVLREVPAAIRFISAEPLLGSLFENGGQRQPLTLDLVDWLIVGGESGTWARPLDLRWAVELATAWDDANVAFFMKQLGTIAGRTAGARDRKGGDLSVFPADLQRRELPRIATSSELEATCS